MEKLTILKGSLVWVPRDTVIVSEDFLKYDKTKNPSIGIFLKVSDEYDMDKPTADHSLVLIEGSSWYVSNRNIFRLEREEN